MEYIDNKKSNKSYSQDIKSPLKLQVEGIILQRMLRAKRRIIYLVDLDSVHFVLSIQSESLEPVPVTVVSKIDFIATKIHII